MVIELSDYAVIILLAIAIYQNKKAMKLVNKTFEKFNEFIERGEI